MENGHIVTDMALESAQAVNYGLKSDVKNLSYDVQKRTLNIKNAEQAKELARERGVYVTYDCPPNVFDVSGATEYLTKCLAKTIGELVGIVKKSSPVLVVGLGNRRIVADSLGERVIEGVKITRRLHTASCAHSVCAFGTGVLGTTGMQSAEIVAGIASKIKPSVVILVDSLATGAISRLGRSFQLSSSGIAPGSGVGQDKERIDKSVLGVPTISIGVPLMLALRTGIYAFFKDYEKEKNLPVDEFSLRQRLADASLSNLIVVPKDIDFSVTRCARVVSSAINLAFRT